MAVAYLEEDNRNLLVGYGHVLGEKGRGVCTGDSDLAEQSEEISERKNEIICRKVEFPTYLCSSQ